MSNVVLTERDWEILDCLSRCVRLFSCSQVSEGFFGADDSNTRRRLRQLAAAGLVDLRQLVTRRVPLARAPLLAWYPGMAEPNFAGLATQLGRRWSWQRTHTERIVVLGPRGASLLGCRYRDTLAHPLHASHDLTVTEVFLRYREFRPESARHWLGEDVIMARSGMPLRFRGATPDAVIVDREGSPSVAIEIGGLYCRDRLARLHRAFSHGGLPYELW